MASFGILQSREDESADQSVEVDRTATVVMILATIFVILRFVSRYITGGKYGWDDWVTVVALGTVFALGGAFYSMVASGMGRHISTLSTSQVEIFFIHLFAYEIVYVTSISTIKIALLLMYLRIFPAKSFRLTAYFIGGIVICWWIAIGFAAIFQCQPIYKAWEPWLEEGNCLVIKSLYIGNAVPNILTDVAILCLPVREISKLNIGTAQKWMLSFTFLLGSFVVFCSIYRFTTLLSFDPDDTTWTLAAACAWCVVETASGVISCCLPTLRPLALKLWEPIAKLIKSKSRVTEVPTDPPREINTIGGGGGGARNKPVGGLYDVSWPTTMSTDTSTVLRSGNHDTSGQVTSHDDGIRVEVQHEIHNAEPSAGA